jgi:uncharacterized protein YjbJ (UPF0337 family)
METEHTETVVEKAVAYVKDFFGVPPGDRTPDVEGAPVTPSTVPEDGLTSEEAMRLDPHAYAFNKIVERSQRVDSMDTEHAKSAAEAHVQAAEQIDRAEGSVQSALGEIQDISRGMKESMHDGKKLPSESEMQQAVERAKATDGTLIPE